MKRTCLALLATVVFLAGCEAFGPTTLPRDRFNYNQAISDSWKEQTLLNIVKVRYSDMPLFVEVASVVSGYSLESSVNLGGQLSSPNAVQGDSVTLGTAGRFTDRPTITYAPITGAKFNESFMTPIQPSTILFLMQAGWRADLIFPMTVTAVNGLRSRMAASANQRAGDPEYYRLVALLREVQKSGAVGLRIIKEGEKETTVLFFFRKNMTPDVEAAILEVRRLLGIAPGDSEITVSYGLLPKGDRDIAMLTRSMLDIMVDFATQIDVPPQHVAKGFTVPASDYAAQIDSPARRSPDGSAPDETGGDIPANGGRLIHIHSGKDEPEGAFVAVPYEDHWFWIEKGDFASKNAFSFLMILFSLSESGGKEGLPLVTIPAG